MAYVDSILTFLTIWSIQIAAAALVASVACWLLRKSPGNVHAAIWIAVLIFAWIVPFAPFAIPARTKIALYRPVIEGVDVSGTPAAILNNYSTLLNERPPQKLDRRTRGGVTPPNIPNDSFVVNRSKSLSTNGSKTTPDSLQWMFVLKTTLLLVWMVGVLLFAFRWIRLKNRLQHILRIAREIEDHRVLETVERTRQLLFLEGPIRTLTADALVAPFVMGLRKPVLFLPSTVVKTWSPREIQAIVGHELGHLRRYDLYVHTAMQALRAVLWFWPPVWWMQRELHRAQDAACDECAAVVLGGGMQFGEVLTRMAEHCLIQDYAFPALGIVHTRHALIKRLENIMNQKIVKLTRVSLRYKLSLSILFVLMFGVCGVFSRTVASQTLNLKFLNNYPNYSIEKALYSDPYFTVIHQKKGDRYVTFYSEINGSMQEEKQLRQKTPVGDESVSHAISSDRYTLIVRKIDGETYIGWLVDRTDFDRKIEFDFPSMENASLRCVRLWGDEIYVLVDRLQALQAEDGSIECPEGSYLYRFGSFADGSEVQRFIYSLPSTVQADDFALVEEGVLFVVLSNVDSQRYVAAAPWPDSSHFTLGTKRWFFENTPTGIQQPICIESSGSNVYVSLIKQGSTSKEEIVVVDWSDLKNPNVIERVAVTDSTNERVQMLSTFSVSEDGRWLGARLENIWLEEPQETEADIFMALYERIGGAYQLVSTFPYFPYDFSFGESSVIGLEAQNIHAYNLEDIENPKQLTFPLEDSDSIYKVAAAGSYVYYAVPDGSQHRLVTLDAALPSDIQIVDEKTLDLPQPVQIAAHDSLLSIHSQGDSKIYSYAFDENGAVVSEIPSPVFPDDLNVSRVSHVDWNDSLFVLSCMAYARDDPSESNHFILIYQRMPNGFGELLSKIKFSDVAISGLNIIDDVLVLTTNGSKILEGSSRRIFVDAVSLYSLDNPQRPELLAERDLVSSLFSTSVIYSICDNYYVYSVYLMDGTQESAKVLDIRDPQNPKELDIQLPNFSYATWYNEILVMKTVDGLRFYSIEGGLFKEIGLIENISTIRSLLFANHRMYAPRMTKGLDVYQIHIDGDSSVRNWMNY